MKRLFCLAMGLCVLSLQACAAQDEPRTIRADVSTNSQAIQQNTNVLNPAPNSNEPKIDSLNANTKAEYKPYLIYEDEGIDKNAIKESKSLDFGDDPLAEFLADIIDADEIAKKSTQEANLSNIQNHSQSYSQTNNILANTQTAQTNNVTSQKTPSQNENHTTSFKNNLSQEHELKNNFVSTKFGNMEKCTEVIIQHMLQSPIFKEHAHSALVLGKVTNKTGDDSLPIGQLENVLQKTVSNANFIRIVQADLEKSTKKFDYTTNILVLYADDNNKKSLAQNSLAQNKGKHRQYTIRIQLLNYYGELVGQWSAQTTSI